MNIQASLISGLAAVIALNRAFKEFLDDLKKSASARGPNFSYAPAQQGVCFEFFVDCTGWKRMI
jgi:hypothetical protein